MCNCIFDKCVHCNSLRTVVNKSYFSTRSKCPLYAEICPLSTLTLYSHGGVRALPPLAHEGTGGALCGNGAGARDAAAGPVICTAMKECCLWCCWSRAGPPAAGRRGAAGGQGGGGGGHPGLRLKVRSCLVFEHPAHFCSHTHRHYNSLLR